MLMDASEILVVDDDRNIRETLADVLRYAGYRVELAENGERALEIIRRGPLPAVVLLDLMMPVMSGWEFLELAEQDETLRTLPVVVVSALPAPLAPCGAEGGVKDCLHKPVDIDRLLTIVDQLSRQARERLSRADGQPRR
jgi:CheY-like chemotaxis protein